MCLGVPGKVVDIHIDESGLPMGKIDFGGITKRVCLAYTPDAEIGEYVVVHVGFAISKIDEKEAQQVFDLLAEMEELAELRIPQPDDGPASAAATGSRSRAGTDGEGSSTPATAAKRDAAAPSSETTTPPGGEGSP